MFKWACLSAGVAVVLIELAIQYGIQNNSLKSQDWCAMNGMTFFNRHIEADMCLTKDGRLVDIPHTVLSQPAPVLHTDPHRELPTLPPKKKG